MHFAILMSVVWVSYLPSTYGSPSGSKCVNGSYETLGIPEGKPEVGAITFTPENVYVDDNVFIQCNVKANPKAQIWWSFKHFRDDVKRSFRFSDCNKTLELRGAVNWHTGLYKCLAKNKYGQASSPEAPLQVEINDKNYYKDIAVVKKNKSCLNYGGNVTLSCANINSKGICSWYKNNKSLIVNPQDSDDRLCSFSIQNITETDEGLYQCYMYYDLMTGELTLNINKTDCNANNKIESGRNINYAEPLHHTVKYLFFFLLATFVFF